MSTFDENFNKAVAAVSKKESKTPKGWRQIGGDVNPASHGCIIARDDGDTIELHEIYPSEEAGGKEYARHTQSLFTTKNAYLDKERFNWSHRNTKSAASSSGIESEEEWNALTTERKAEALFSYGVGDPDSGTAKSFSDALPGGVTVGKVKWWSDLSAVKRDISRAERQLKETLKETR